jgi:exosortase/archaeosortase family protein
LEKAEMIKGLIHKLGLYGQRVWGKVVELFQWGISTNHNRIVSCGLLVYVLFLPNWWGEFPGIVKAATDLLLQGCMVYLGVEPIWKNRQQLSEVKPSRAMRQFGHCLILGTAAFFPFSFDSLYLQVFLCILIGVGIVLSNWGLRFFQHYPRSILLIVLGTYPNLSLLANTLRVTYTPDVLENSMAWAGSLVLRAFSYQATASGVYVGLPQGGVKVGDGCDGFEMAFSTAQTGLVMGLFFKQNWRNVTLLVLAGFLLAMTLNVPRIALLAVANVYWGQYWFDFWHERWGGQIFTWVLFTVYYYLAMWRIEQTGKPAASEPVEAMSKP